MPGTCAKKFVILHLFKKISIFYSVTIIYSNFFQVSSSWPSKMQYSVYKFTTMFYESYITSVQRLFFTNNIDVQVLVYE